MSSYDIGVWYSPADLSDAQASDYFARLSGHVVVIEHRPEFDAFLRDLMARFPDRPVDAGPLSPDNVPEALLETWDDLKTKKPAPPMTPEQRAKIVRDGAVFENSPWGESLSANGDTMALPFAWSRAEAIIPVIVSMARQHNLTVYDSQTGRVTNPDRPPTQGAADFLSIHLTLRLSGQAPAVDTMLVQDGQTVLHATMPDRAAAHALARRVAIERHDRAYNVVDPRSLAQGFRAVPTPPGQKVLPDAVITALRKKGITVEEETFEGPEGAVRQSVPGTGTPALSPR